MCRINELIVTTLPIEGKERVMSKDNDRTIGDDSTKEDKTTEEKPVTYVLVKDDRSQIYRVVEILDGGYVLEPSIHEVPRGIQRGKTVREDMIARKWYTKPTFEDETNVSRVKLIGNDTIYSVLSVTTDYIGIDGYAYELKMTEEDIINGSNITETVNAARIEQKWYTDKSLF